MSVTPIVRIQEDDFDIDTEIKALTKDNPNIGAVVTFTGLCRDEDGALSALELEHYPGMAEAEIMRYAEQAIDRFDLSGMVAIHRYGKISPSANIVLVIAASRHRQAAFDGANFLMDFLKTRAPFWKKEYLKSGEAAGWVDSKDSDDKSLKKWRQP